MNDRDEMVETIMGGRFIAAMTMVAVILVAGNGNAENQRVCPRAFDALASSNWPLAIRLYTHCLKQKDLPRASRAKAHSYRALAFSLSRKYFPAIADNTSAIVYDPGNSEYYNARGVDLLKVGQVDRALADYTKAIELNPLNSYAFHNRGAVYSEQGKYERAIADFDAAIRVKPDNAGAFVTRGVTYVAMGRYETGVADYTKAIALEPNNHTIYQRRGFARFFQGRYADAAKDFGLAAQMHGNNRYSALLYVVAAAWREWQGATVSQFGGDPMEVGRKAWTTASGEVSRLVRDLDRAGWPGPILGLYRTPLVAGSPEADVARLMRAAGRRSPYSREETLCEAKAYAGHYLLIFGRKAAGVRLLRESEPLCRITAGKMDLVTAVLKIFDPPMAGGTTR